VTKHATAHIYLLTHRRTCTRVCVHVCAPLQDTNRIVVSLAKAVATSKALPDKRKDLENRLMALHDLSVKAFNCEFAILTSSGRVLMLTGARNTSGCKFLFDCVPLKWYQHAHDTHTHAHMLYANHTSCIYSCMCDAIYLVCFKLTL
jgi:hypothetical protein